MMDAQVRLSIMVYRITKRESNDSRFVRLAFFFMLELLVIVFALYDAMQTNIRRVLSV